MGSQPKVIYQGLLYLLVFSCPACTQKSHQSTNAEHLKTVAAHSVEKPDSTTDTMLLQANGFVTGLREQDDYAAIHGSDSLMDINGDGYRDLLIEYYRGSGSGFKNAVDIYLYDLSGNAFRSEEINLSNPTFYFDKKVTTSYYIGTGGGYACSLRWSGKSLDTLEYITVEVSNKKAQPEFIITTKHSANGNLSSKVTDIIKLPPAYRYGAYVPLIKLSRH